MQKLGFSVPAEKEAPLEGNKKTRERSFASFLGGSLMRQFSAARLMEPVGGSRSDSLANDLGDRLNHWAENWLDDFFDARNGVKGLKDSANLLQVRSKEWP